MEITRQSFQELDGVIDDLHKTLDRWESNGAFTSELEPDTVQLVKLAIHEWVANLVQHADFGDVRPEIILDIYPNGQSIRCVIQDNSQGFDAAKHLRIRMENLEPLPERGMGLLMLDAATDYFEYLRSENGLHRLEFSVSSDMDPWLNIPF
ncbi:MAG: ATP-binding protein [Rhodothermia bacterium]|nr:MAG: ATP-binding protein [Rhodothermia bacterium]